MFLFLPLVRNLGGLFIVQKSTPYQYHHKKITGGNSLVFFMFNVLVNVGVLAQEVVTNLREGILYFLINIVTFMDFNVRMTSQGTAMAIRDMFHEIL